eukprot:GEMP01095344.1.p1 GENE.GEMP01095344.1~~GEMP01095344.1.p1  ORF type:complete len:171 (+),score=31.45 GEMP01095344.1:35-547(+)
MRPSTSKKHANDMLLHLDAPWDGHCLLRVPPEFDSQVFEDDEAKISFTNDEGVQQLTVNGTAHPLRFAKLDKTITASVSRTGEIFSKVANIHQIGLVGNARLQENEEFIEESAPWTEAEHLEVFEVAQKLLTRKPMIFVEEAEVDETVYHERLRNNPDSIWTQERPSERV